jgi:putative glycosyltransferase (TIGR04372 family)
MKMYFDKIKAQYIQVRDGGISVLIHKLKKSPYRLLLLLIDLICLPLTIPIALLLRIIKPIVNIKLGYFYGARIGHFAIDTAMAAISDRQREDVIKMYYFLPGVCNQQWAKMVKREMPVYFWVRLLAFADSILPLKGSNLEPPGVMQKIHSRDVDGSILNSDFSFGFTEKEVNSVKSWLYKKGWRDGEKIVCVLVRDNTYLKTELNTRDWSYHDYRNSNIANYVPAMEMLAERGYWVFRMGKVMNAPVSSAEKRVVDFAFDSERSDLIDVWLFANCSLCISTGTGPDTISDVYRRDILHLNYLPLTHMWSWSKAMYAPKKLYWQDSGLRLTWREYIEHNYFYMERYENARIRVEELSADEICAAVGDKIERIEGSWVATDIDTQLHLKFLDIAKSEANFTECNNFIHPEMCVAPSFLHEFPGWVEE